MDDNQRNAMFNAWASAKKWVEVEVKELEDGSGWMAKPKTDLGCVVYRDTKAQVIYSIHGLLASKGYEISNLAEIQGL